MIDEDVEKILIPNTSCVNEFFTADRKLKAE